GVLVALTTPVSNSRGCDPFVRIPKALRGYWNGKRRRRVRQGGGNSDRKRERWNDGRPRRDGNRPIGFRSFRAPLSLAAGVPRLCGALRGRRFGARRSGAGGRAR